MPTTEFFDAISSTNYVALSRFLSNANFDINIVNSDGFWPLQIAIDQEDLGKFHRFFIFPNFSKTFFFNVKIRTRRAFAAKGKSKSSTCRNFQSYSQGQCYNFRFGN